MVILVIDIARCAVTIIQSVAVARRAVTIICEGCKQVTWLNELFNDTYQFVR